MTCTYKGPDIEALRVCEKYYYPATDLPNQAGDFPGYWFYSILPNGSKLPPYSQGSVLSVSA